MDQIRVDIQSYLSHECCGTLVFVIVDAVRDIPDPRLVEHEMSGRLFAAERFTFGFTLLSHENDPI